MSYKERPAGAFCTYVIIIPCLLLSVIGGLDFIFTALLSAINSM